MKRLIKIKLVCLLTAILFYSLPLQAQNVKLLTISGQINNTLYVKLKKLNLKNDFSAIPGGLIVFLDSTGGDIDAAINIGEILRQNNAQTFVTGKCASACILIFAAGVIRDAPELSLGIHRFTVDNYNKNTKKLEPATLSIDTSNYSLNTQIKLANYFIKMGIDKSLTKIMEQTPPNEINWLSHDLAKKLKLIGYEDTYLNNKLASINLKSSVSESSYINKINTIANNCILSSKFTTNEFLYCYKQLLKNEK